MDSSPIAAKRPRSIAQNTTAPTTGACGVPAATAKIPHRRLTGAAALLPVALLAGCAADFGKNVSSPAPLASLSGKVHGGQQPVTGAQVFFYAAGTGGYGTPARSMLSGPGYVITDTTGAFSITGDYTCQTGDQVYLLATGGNPGLVTGTTNPALALMAALGPCSALTPSTFITVNEVTTVAAAYALAGFMNTPTNLSFSGSALAKVGVTNAFLNAANPSPQRPALLAQTQELSQPTFSPRQPEGYGPVTSNTRPPGASSLTPSQTQLLVSSIR